MSADEKSTVHVVIDLETLNTTSWKPAIFQLGLAAVTPDGSKHYWQGTCRYSTLTADSDTWEWWHTKEREDLFQFLTSDNTNKYSDQEALLLQATKVIRKLKGDNDIAIYGNSPSFDLIPFHVVLGSSKLPWNFRDEVCLRTVKGLYMWEDLPSELDFEELEAILDNPLLVKPYTFRYPINKLVKHNALYDAAIELEQLIYMVQAMGRA
jgi:hypothetical protein